jgi:CheY-like chemotaxis protein
VEVDPAALTVLVVEDRPEEAMLYEKFFRGTGYRPVVARTMKSARQMLGTFRPHAVILDILLGGDDAWGLLAELKGAEATRGVPVIVASTVDDRQKGFALGADAYGLKPIARAWLLETLDGLVRPPRGAHVLVVDDDEIARYVLRSALERAALEVREAATAPEGLRLASENPPAVIFLDLVMPGQSGFELLDELKASCVTRDIPVVVVSSKRLAPDESDHLAAHGARMLSKEDLPGDEGFGLLSNILMDLGLEERR